MPGFLSILHHVVQNRMENCFIIEHCALYRVKYILFMYLACLNKLNITNRPGVGALALVLLPFPADESGDRFPFDLAPNGSKSKRKLFYN